MQPAYDPCHPSLRLRCGRVSTLAQPYCEWLFVAKVHDERRNKSIRKQRKRFGEGALTKPDPQIGIREVLRPIKHLPDGVNGSDARAAAQNETKPK